jgi:hypothetical protein
MIGHFEVAAEIADRNARASERQWRPQVRRRVTISATCAREIEPRALCR